MNNVSTSLSAVPAREATWHVRSDTLFHDGPLARLWPFRLEGDAIISVLWCRLHIVTVSATGIKRCRPAPPTSFNSCRHLFPQAPCRATRRGMAKVELRAYPE